jgi:hypothetical protein
MKKKEIKNNQELDLENKNEKKKNQQMIKMNILMKNKL